MAIQTKFKRFAAVLGIFVLLFSLVLPVSAAKVEQTKGQEVIFSAEYPVDFNQLIVITLLSSETGYLYTYYLNPDLNYETRPLIPCGEYSVSATISSPDTDNDDATTYAITLESEKLVVQESATAPVFSFVVEGYTNPDQEFSEKENTTSSNEKTNTVPSGSSDESCPPVNQDATPSSDSELEVQNRSVFKSMIFSTVAIVVFFVGGYCYRRYKEG